MSAKTRKEKGDRMLGSIETWEVRGDTAFLFFDPSYDTVLYQTFEKKNPHGSIISGALFVQFIINA